ncbi:MAG: NADH-quinone oxidoreductase subunit B [Dehalobacter sp. 4CP]|jgi:NADH-quinone oxidoreductase subunit B|uniref:NADH-quinone oxidoreductase subunit B n=1 Tax=Dehalobacter restrictus (strain DSM 9455 / PER-K23) TaxID=871738 RepID=A0ABN4BTV1_DEHRP|nr:MULTISPECIES: NADH-quinone oxidoreductase subunit B [Dehalobacter]NBJ14470.1 NADH-quinone oxidoreductase subunit B [Dehalobacter sp. 4CP]AHF09431.1 NADH-quinone oxidoreductase subunit B [Dehalobacter restrictus DSM 9455]MCG1025970.1 NADH-quinone oxidoreductase subunit B [Dehalobacter sp.]MCM1567716.1 NADH-quinone oxidoreductase subunit B [Dehalobacter sp.]MDJ0304470.1 NADH-quinone oxidoreductase subunit B [Dehalobacter sp.]
MDVVKKNYKVEVPEYEMPNNIIMCKIEDALNWCRSRSFWPLTFGLACCAFEMMAAGDARYDIARFGSEVFRPSPRQCDLLIIAGTVTKKMEPIVARLYEQMAEPKYVLAMGSCAISGGPFKDSYSVVKGADTFLPVDVYVPGCPPRPEALFYGLLELRKKVTNPRKFAENNKERIMQNG